MRQYLKEIGYTDTIIDVRSNRVRSLLGLSNFNEEYSNEQATNKVLNQAQVDQAKRERKFAKTAATDAESSVLATFDFLTSAADNGMIEGIEDDEDVLDNDSGSLGGEEVLNEFDMFLNPRMDLNDNNLANWKGGGGMYFGFLYLFTYSCCFKAAKDVDIGELATLTEPSNVIECATTVNNEVRKTWSQKYILK